MRNRDKSCILPPMRRLKEVSQFVVLLVSLSCLVVAAKEHAGTSTPVVGRDWKLHPAVVQLPQPQSLYALGDVHGDYDRMVALLASNKLIADAPASPKSIVWTGGKATLVVVGDMIDKFTQSLAVLQSLRALEPQAAQAGGRVVICLGNHEAEFLADGGDGKKSAEFASELKAAGSSAGLVAAGRDADGLGAWLRDLPAGALVGDWFFCHAGNTGQRTIARLESDLEKDLAEKGFATPLLIDPNSMLEARMHPRPWWDATADPALHEAGTSHDPNGSARAAADSGASTIRTRRRSC